ncbi:MAG: glycosyltransferase family 2 protein [Candidatus Helarchaeota archaeon]
MPRLRSIGWSLLALAFLMACGTFIWFIFILIYQVLQINPYFILDIFLWPITHNITGNFLANIWIVCAWNCFLAGLGFLMLNYVIKIFYQKPQVKKVKSKLPRIDELSKIIAVIPAYNEESTIGEVIKRVQKYVNEIIVVNDGSTDSTAKIADEAGAFVFTNDYNMGLGVTMKNGLRIAKRLKADIIITMDADGQYLPEEIPNILEPIINLEADLVLGSRVNNKSKMGIINKIGNRVFTWAVNRFSGLHLKDTQTGFRAIRREILEEIKITSDYTYTQELVIRCAEEGFRIGEVPVTFLKRKQGKSRLISDPADYALNVSIIGLRIYRDYHPLALFGGIGTAFLAAGILLGTYVVYGYLIASLQIGLAILSVFLMIMGIQILIFGLLADMFLTKNIKSVRDKANF